MAETTKKRKTLVGIVSKRSNPNTMSVNVEKKFRHPKYGKIVKSHKKYLVHIENTEETFEAGEEVVIEESKPISKRKSWIFISKFNKK